MLNINTVLSVFDDKPTLLKWLKKVEAALNNASLTSVTLNSAGENQVTLTFHFADETTITSDPITLPQGPQGPQGEPGTSSEPEYIELNGLAGGTLTAEQIELLLESDQNYIKLSPNSNTYTHDFYYAGNPSNGLLVYSCVINSSLSAEIAQVEFITINTTNNAWVYSSVQTSAGGGGGSGITIVTIPQDGVSTNPVMSGTIELASPENTVIKIYNGEDNDGARYTYSILTSFDENASGDVPEYVYSGEDYIVTCTKSNGNTYNYTLTETPTPSVDITYATDSDIEALFSRR